MIYIAFLAPLWGLKGNVRWSY